MEFILIVALWILTNVVVKLLVNSLERIWKDRIDETLRYSPRYLAYSLLEVLRIFLFVLLLPNIVLYRLWPFGKRSPALNMVRYELPQFLSRKEFHARAPFNAFLLRHPTALFNAKKQRELIRQWRVMRSGNDPSTKSLGPRA